MQPTNRQFQTQFTIKSSIGSGTFGQVFKCLNNKTSQICAVKIISRVNPINIQKIQEQVQIMKRIQSDYSLELLDHFYDDMTSSYVLVTPYCRKGSLQKKMKENWEMEELLLFLAQITEGFLEFSAKQVMHLDLKPENILIKNIGQYVVCDFGCSKVHQSMQNSVNFLKMSLSKGIGTAEYIAPEVRNNYQANKYSDIWSLGVILYKMIYHKTPFTKIQGFGAYKTKYQGHKPDIQPIISLLQSMLSQKKRISWLGIKKKIYQILKIPQHLTIVTSISNYVQYIQDLSILATCLFHYIQRVKIYLQRCKIDIKPLIQTFLQYLCHITEQTFNCQEYFFFQIIKNQIKVDQKAQILSINKQIKKIMEEKNIKNDQHMKILQKKKILLQQAKKINKSLNSLPQKAKKYFYDKLQLQYFKVQQIMQFISFQYKDQDNLHYIYKKDLRNMIDYLIHA